MLDRSAQRMSFCGVPLDAIDMDRLLSLFKRSKLNSEQQLIFHHNLHSVYLFLTNAEFRATYAKASCVYIDGLPIVWLGRAAGLPLKASHRITFLDCFEEILNAAAEAGWRVFYLGSREEVVKSTLPLLRERYPRLVISGRNGYFAKDESANEEVISQINKFCPDILFVGMGMPKQEMWLAEHYTRLNAHSIVTSGATLDYVSGHQYKPPEWAGPLGLYGVFRLLSDFKRLWRRYLIEPIVVTMYLSWGIIRQRLHKAGKDWSQPRISEE